MQLKTLWFFNTIFVIFVALPITSKIKGLTKTMKLHGCPETTGSNFKKWLGRVGTNEQNWVMMYVKVLGFPSLSVCTYIYNIAVLINGLMYWLETQTIRWPYSVSQFWNNRHSVLKSTISLFILDVLHNYTA